MKHLLLALALCLISASAGATFEIADPANEMYEEQEAQPQVDEVPSQRSGPFCVTDAEVDKCWCFDRDTGDRVDMSEEECRGRAAERSDAEE
jgi:hypothetical protein